MPATTTYGAELAKRINKVPGWRVTKTRDGYRVLSPQGTDTIAFHANEPDARGEKNLLADLKRCGFITDEREFLAEQDRQRRHKLLADRQAAARKATKASAQQSAVERAAGPYLIAPFDLDWLLTPTDFPQVRIGIITPAIAEKLLAHNNINRPTYPGSMRFWRAQFQRDPVIGELGYELTHQGLAINSLGELIDGQHRLLVCVELGVSFETQVTVGLRPRVYKKVDSGRPRSGADSLYAKGEGNRYALAAMLTMVYLYDHVEHTLWSTTTVTSDQRDRVLEADEQAARRAVVLGLRMSKNIRLVQAAATTGVYLLQRANPGNEHAESFLNGLVTGTDIPIGDIRPTLTHQLAQRNEPRRHRTLQLAMFINTWNIFNSGKRRTLTLHKGEAFPRISVRG